jgi:vanillate O-demethylase ferredoxin subunit
MAERLHHVGADYELHYCARALSRMAFHQELASSAFVDKVHLHLDDGPASQKLDLNAVLRSEAEAGTHLYVCGPTGFIELVLATAAALGFAKEALHREFFSVDSTKEREEGSPFQIQIASTGQILNVPRDRSALEVMREHGIPVPASCELGVCGTCITRILDGIPDHRDLILNEKERIAGDQFTPCCSRAKSPLLVLDL